MQRCWGQAVEDAFPNRRFVVEYVDEEVDENEYGQTVYLYQADIPTEMSEE
jgi:hypothetical protein